MTALTRFITFSLTTLLYACSTFQGKPMPLPPPTPQAQIIVYAQTGTLEKMGSISVNVRGSTDDADRAIQQRADAYGARYYTITLKQEHALTNTWTSRAVLYR
ncbi:biofilm peroxide resistance protein BsmA [Symbiopectobacterium purcellii]|uniref:biofilm peroxide resistance protein BsmA n=1 Tax=Symbiopectobacterium purcellii TaxID=2871826 RepID=UPI003F84FCEB